MSQTNLLFVSTRFLFPVDSGGKIRTTQTLRGMKGGQFRITLVSPATEQETAAFGSEIDTVCDEFVHWPVAERGPLFNLLRMRYLFQALPIPIRTDFHKHGAQLIERLMEKADVVVFDFLHAAVLAPEVIKPHSVLFTHNVEAEIFQRHISAADNFLFRWIWRNQYKKMFNFEQSAVHKFDRVVAVSERDAGKFKADYGLANAHCIPTGVDLEFFSYSAPSRFNDVVFCGSMDWLANQDAIEFFLAEVWPLVLTRHPDARFTVIGRSPPAKLIEAGARFGDSVQFTGFVDDIRDYQRGAVVNVIPIRVGGGTRLKVYEAMAIGTPVVSTTIGVEGLPVEHTAHYLNADQPNEFADAVVELLQNPQLAEQLARRARELVEQEFSFMKAAKSFEEACVPAVAFS